MLSVSVKQLVGLNKNFHNVKLGNFRLRQGEALKLGDLSGNRFTITVREVSERSDELIRSGLESLKMKGFVNYFGLQRFGTCDEAPTHAIGKLLIQNKIKEAIELILKPRESFNEKQEVHFARKLWHSDHSKASSALAIIERINCVEKYLLTGLSECTSNDHLGAFHYIPRNMRLMYLHAYQSYIWNHMVSKRLQLYGQKPVVGDLVQRISPSESLVKLQEKQEVIVVTAENLTQFGMENVVLPLPGHTIIYPENQMKRHYEELLALDGISLIDGFQNKIKDFSLGGDYRNVLVKPYDMKYQLISYSDKTKDLAQSDWERMQQNNINIDQEQSAFIDLKEDGDAPYKALVVEYSLPSSAYATMALRELLIDEPLRA